MSPLTIGLIAAGCLALLFTFILWACCKAASDADDREGRDDLD